MKQITVDMKGVKMNGVFVCDKNGGYKKIDDSEINNVNGKDVGLIAFTLDDEYVQGGYVNMDISCISSLSREIPSEILNNIYGESNGDSYTYHFSIHNNGEGYPIDHFSLYDTPLADQGINYSDDGNLELTFEVNEDNFQSSLVNDKYDFSVDYI